MTKPTLEPQKGAMTTDATDDERVLALRSQGRSFVAIASELGMGSASLAYAAYQRALRGKSPQQRDAYRRHELERLDQWAERLRAERSDGDPDAERKLVAIERLRAVVLAEWDHPDPAA
jgi:hypothetical protein